MVVSSRDFCPPSCEQIEIEALRHLNSVGEVLTPMQLVSIAGLTGLSVHNARSKLSRMEEHGLLRLPDITHLRDLVADSGMLELIDRNMTRMRRTTRRMEFLPRKPCLAITSGIHGRFSTAS